MLISIEELKDLYSHKDFSKYNDKLLEKKLKVIEEAIRQYTHNNFQERACQGYTQSDGHTMEKLSHMWLKKGDTIQISLPKENEGLYTIKQIIGHIVEVDAELYPAINLVTLVKYPEEIIDGAVELLDWELNQKPKSSVSSETISRHSVTYKNYDGNNTIKGYPAELFGFAKGYCKART